MHRVGARFGVGREHEPADEQLAQDLPRHLRLTTEEPVPLGEPSAQRVADAMAPLGRTAQAVQVFEAREGVRTLPLTGLQRVHKGRDRAARGDASVIRAISS